MATSAPARKLPRQSSGRIPQELLDVFMTSNQGDEVHQPPEGNLAFQAFEEPSKETAPSSDSSSFFRRSLGKRKDSKKEKKELTKSNSNGSLGNYLNLTNPGNLFRQKSAVEERQAQMPSPQQFLDHLLKERGYSTRTFSTLKTAYYSEPSNLQRASYHPYFFNMVMLPGSNGVTDRKKKNEGFDEEDYHRNLKWMDQCLRAGVSPNACNSHGDTLLHALCRSGQKPHVPVVQMLLNHHASVQVSNEQGRTILHEACARVKQSRHRRKTAYQKKAPRPCFEIVDMILQRDLGLFQLTDGYGSTPLQGVPKEHWGLWIRYLDSKKDVFWPMSSPSFRDGSESSDTLPRHKQVPPLVALAPNTLPIQDPYQNLSPKLAGKLVSGQMEPSEVEEHYRVDNSDSRSLSQLSLPSLQSFNDDSDIYDEIINGQTDTEETSRVPDDVSLDDSFIQYWVKPNGSDTDNDTESDADTINLGGIALPTLRYAMVNKEYSYNSDASSVFTANQAGGGSESDMSYQHEAGQDTSEAKQKRNAQQKEELQNQQSHQATLKMLHPTVGQQPRHKPPRKQSMTPIDKAIAALSSNNSFSSADIEEDSIFDGIASVSSGEPSAEYRGASSVGNSLGSALDMKKGYTTSDNNDRSSQPLFPQASTSPYRSKIDLSRLAVRRPPKKSPKKALSPPSPRVEEGNDISNGLSKPRTESLSATPARIVSRSSSNQSTSSHVPSMQESNSNSDFSDDESDCSTKPYMRFL